MILPVREAQRWRWCCGGVKDRGRKMFFLLGSEICLHSIESLLKLFNRLNLLPYVNFFGFLPAQRGEKDALCHPRGLTPGCALSVSSHNRSVTKNICRTEEMCLNLEASAKTDVWAAVIGTMRQGFKIKSAD